MCLKIIFQLLGVLAVAIPTHSVVHLDPQNLAKKAAEGIISAKKLTENQNKCAFYMLPSSASSTVNLAIPYLHSDWTVPVSLSEITHLWTGDKNSSYFTLTHTFPCEIYVLDSSMAPPKGRHVASLGRTGKNVFLFLGPFDSAEWSDELTHIKWRFCLRHGSRQPEPVIFDNKITKAVETGRVNLAGSHLTVSGLAVPPYMLLNGDRNVIGGTFVQIFEVASKYYNFSYEVSTNPKPTGALSANGTWTGMMGDVIHGKKDIGMCIHVTYERWGHADFTTFMFNERALFLLAHPENFHSLSALVRPLSWKIWLLYIATFIGILPVLYASFKRDHSDSRHHHPKHKDDALALAILFTYSTSVDQGVEIRKNSAKILMALWLFFVLILSTCYKDKLMLYLTFPEQRPIPRNLEQVHYIHKDFRMIFHFWGSTMLDRFKNKHNPMMLSLGKRLELERDAAKCVTEATIHQGTLCLGVRSFLSVAMAKNVTLSTAFQSYLLSEELFSPIYLSFMLRKNSIYTQPWQEIAGRFRESALIPKWNQDVFNGFKKQGRVWMLQQRESQVYKTLLQTMKNSGGGGGNEMEKPLGVTQFLAVFILYALLHVAFLIVFAWELKKHWVIAKVTSCRATRSNKPESTFRAATYPLLFMRKLVDPKLPAFPMQHVPVSPGDESINGKFSAAATTTIQGSEADDEMNGRLNQT